MFCHGLVVKGSCQGDCGQICPSFIYCCPNILGHMKRESSLELVQNPVSKATVVKCTDIFSGDSCAEVIILFKANRMEGTPEQGCPPQLLSECPGHQSCVCSQQLGLCDPVGADQCRSWKCTAHQPWLWLFRCRSTEEPVAWKGITLAEGNMSVNVPG